MKPVRTPPHDNQAEQALLGGLMLSPAAYDRVADRLTEQDFYREVHGLIFRAIGELRENNQPCDAVTVGEWFERHGNSELVEGGAYLTMLVTETPGPTNVKAYADIIREKSIQRRIIEIGTELADGGLEQADTDALLERAWSELESVTRTDSGGSVPLMQAAGEWLDRLGVIASGDMQPLNSGLMDWDRRIGGMYAGELHVIGGRPGAGKSVLALEIAMHQGPALIWTGEMARTQLISRMVAGAGVSGRQLRNPASMSEQDWDSVTGVIAGLKDRQVWIDDTPALNVNTLLMRTRQAVRKHGIKVLVVDYLQLLSVKAESRLQEVSAISRSLKRIAKDCEIPVVAVSQLNRAVEARTDKRPRMADLRESGQLEQDAETITMLYRHGYYDESDETGIMELIVAKNRNGETGTEYALFQPERTRIVNADRELIAEYRARQTTNKPTRGPYSYKRSGM